METLRLLIGPDDGSATALQLCVRAIFLFAAGIFFIRVAGRRTFSQSSPLDIIVAIVVGSNISRMMTGKAPFLAGLAATFALVLLHRAVAMASLYWPALAAIVKCRPVLLVRDGVVDKHALKSHGLSEGDLLEGLRMEKAADPSHVSLAMLEGGGKISVVAKTKD